VSTSIKPPTGSAGGAQGVEGASDVADVSAAHEAGKASEVARAAAPAGADAAQSPTAAWLHKVATGEATRAEAVDALVAQALEAQGGAKLSPAQRSELEGILRSALLEDPVLSRLLGGE
jgi:hypothetical protein